MTTVKTMTNSTTENSQSENHDPCEWACLVILERVEAIRDSSGNMATPCARGCGRYVHVYTQEYLNRNYPDNPYAGGN